MRNIVIKGAKSHNLKNIDLTIPRDKLIVITGLSGSGKSSLAFDTIFAEGQRRYVESLSAYARQFLARMERPDVDSIEGLSPAISIEQKTTSHNPRSTVGTVTEIHDYLRLLYARAGTPICPEHKCSLEAKTVNEIVMELYENIEENTPIQILSPFVRNRKGEHKEALLGLKQKGFIRVNLDNETYLIDEIPKIDPKKNHTIDIVIDRVKLTENIKTRLTESIEIALEHGNDVLKIYVNEDIKTFSTKFACPICDYSIPELEPRLFSFNSPVGACPECDGLGIKQYFDKSKIINEELSINDGAIKGWTQKNEFYFSLMQSLSKEYSINLDTPFKLLSKKNKSIILDGSGEKEIKYFYYNSSGKKINKKNIFEGIINNFERRYYNSDSFFVKEELGKYMSKMTCDACNGTRLSETSRNVFINDLNIAQLSNLSIEKILYFFNKLEFSGKKKIIAEKLIHEISSRLNFLVDVGLDYLTLDRSAETLSGGENQRIRLASQIGAGLVGVTYILDEPSIGLHQRDNEKLIKTLKYLKNLGNTVIVVEHDEATIKSADYIIDIGPFAGQHGGNVVFAGELKKLLKSNESLTSQYINGVKKISIPKKKLPNKNFIKIQKASSNNLKNIDANIPVGLFTCVTGVSGSGKSTLINDTLLPFIHNHINKYQNTSNNVKSISGVEFFDKVIEINQSPIGRTPRSNPATYTGLFTLIRDLFAATKESRSRGYSTGRFSFNVKGGRCEACRGDGVIKVEMHFLPDVYVKCDVCKGKRYNDATLEILYKNKNISEILDMTVEEAYNFFENVPTIKNKLQTLVDVGLSYIKIGQNATTLSGGEAQRVKLAKELSRRDTGRTLYLFDEPTTGLHSHDIDQLLKIIYFLKEKGNTIVVIEHNMDVIKTSDWVIDLGPDGGQKGGEILFEGMTKDIVKCKKSYTGKFLKDYFSA